MKIKVFPTTRNEKIRLAILFTLLLLLIIFGFQKIKTSCAYAGVLNHTFHHARLADTRFFACFNNGPKFFGPMKVSVYIEEGATVVGLKNLDTIAEKAINDFPAHIAQNYPAMSLGDAGRNSLNVVFFNRESWERLNRVTGEIYQYGDTLECYGAYWVIVSARYIFMPAGDLVTMQDVLRHELFHHLASVYGVENRLPTASSVPGSNEPLLADRYDDAYRFEKFRQSLINK